jgi:patatin-related protein
MREKELRLALVCYGGVSLAVYMHGITKEVWRLARASQAFHGGDEPGDGSQGAYHRLLQSIADTKQLQLRVLPDIFAGASAGGINAIFLAHAISTGQSLDPLTQLWLEGADVDALIALMARDKKAVDGLTFVLDGPAGVQLVGGVDPDQVRLALEAVR